MLANRKNIKQYILDNIDKYEGKHLYDLRFDFANQKIDRETAEKELLSFVNDKWLDGTSTQENGIFGAVQTVVSDQSANYTKIEIDDFKNPVALEKAVNDIRIDRVMQRIGGITGRYLEKMTKDDINQVKDLIKQRRI